MSPLAFAADSCDSLELAFGAGVATGAANGSHSPPNSASIASASSSNFVSAVPTVAAFN